jgi:hypothetical protein
MDDIKDGSADADVMAKWPDSPEYAGDAGREISSLAASTLYLLAPLLGLGKKYLFDH